MVLRALIRKRSSDWKPPSTRGFLLWGAALIIGVGVVALHRRRDPGDVRAGTFKIAGTTQEYQLPKSWAPEPSTGQIQMRLPEDPPPFRPSIVLKLEGDMPDVRGAVNWRPDAGDQPFSAVQLAPTRRRVTKPGSGTRQWLELQAALPRLKPGTRIEYFVYLETGDETLRLPLNDAPPVVLQYRRSVPKSVNVARIAAVIAALVLAIRAGLSAVFERDTVRRYAWATLLMLTLGAFVLHMSTNWQALRVYWMGYPRGDYWPDTRVALAVLVWLIACVALGRALRDASLFGRGVALLAACVTIALALIV